MTERICPICERPLPAGSHGNRKFCPEHGEDARKRWWDHKLARDCVDCGKHLSAPPAEFPMVRCTPCENARRHRLAYERTIRWLNLRRQGLDNRELAKREGVPPYVVANALQQSRVARFPDLVWEPAPYMNGRRTPKVRNDAP